MVVPDGVRKMLARHEGTFSTGDAGDLAADYRNPVAVFLPEGLRVEETAADTVAVLRRLQATARLNGVVRVTHAITELRAVRPDRPAVTVVWRFLDKTGQELARSRVRYFLAQTADGGFLIEMLEYERTGFDGEGDTALLPRG